MKNIGKKRCISIILLFCMLLSVSVANAALFSSCARCGRSCTYTDITSRKDNGYTSHTITTTRFYQCVTCQAQGYHPTSIVSQETHPYSKTFMGSYDCYGCHSCPAQIWAPHTHNPRTYTYQNWLTKKITVIRKCSECGQVLD